MRNTNPAGNFTVSRILRISPEQNEMTRRNYSRIFIMPVGEGFIDSVLFQGYRPVEGYMDVAKRAVALSGLADISGVNEMRPVHMPRGDGFLQSHIATIGWLEAGDKTVYDLVVEVVPEGEELPDLNFPTSNANMVDNCLDNPVIISVETADLAQKFSPVSGFDGQTADEAGQDAGSDRSPQVEAQGESESQTQTAANDTNGSGADMSGASEDRTPGRVKNPDTDRRLKKNRQGSGSAMARQAMPAMDDRTSGDAGRMAGKPGRVRNALLDGRIKGNRRSTSQPQQAAAGGR